MTCQVQKPHNIKRQRPHGKSGPADLEGVDVAQKVIPVIVDESRYTMDDVYNMDDTGLYYLYYSKGATIDRNIEHC